MQAWHEIPFIQLPLLPDTEPDKCIHTTIRYYHHEPSWTVSRCTHHLYPKGWYLNPKYTIPGENHRWTGAEDSLLLEQIPHTNPPGIRALDSDGTKIDWYEVAHWMTHESRARNISYRQYTWRNCAYRYGRILSQIKNQTSGNGGPEGHTCVNPYGVLIPFAYPLHMPEYIHLDRELVPIGCEVDKAKNLGKRVNVQGIRSITGVGKWVMSDEGIGHVGRFIKLKEEL
ncbi:hypothetical protein VE03_03906 [Pseudogymnoascus sp. 23342-1-I1]|nr:hypothetical protein VE03_03906 [Pseudogymnoascus sp. 23342-1-I1]